MARKNFSEAAKAFSHDLCVTSPVCELTDDLFDDDLKRENALYPRIHLYMRS